LTSKQQIFWGITGAVLAASFGAWLTNWFSKPSAPEVSKLAVWYTVRELPDGSCAAEELKKSFSNKCGMIAVNIKNPTFDDLKNVNVKIDFKDVVNDPISEKNKFDVATRGDFLSSDIVVKSATDFQKNLSFGNFPGLASIQITLITYRYPTAEPKIVAGDATQLVDMSDRIEDDSFDSYLLAGLFGFLLLPLIAGIFAFFQWLSKDNAPTPVSEE
jgi:hypothetical protein